MMIEFTLKNNGELDAHGIPVFRTAWVNKDTIELLIDYEWEIEENIGVYVTVNASSHTHVGSFAPKTRTSRRRLNYLPNHPLHKEDEKIINSYPVYFINNRYEVTAEEFYRVKELICRK